MRLPGFDTNPNLLAPSVLDGAELILGVVFPAVFRAIASQYDGASGGAEFPVPGAKHPAGFGVWLSFDPYTRYSVWSWLAAWQEHELPRTIVPFGEDGGGNLVCLDFRRSSPPEVAMWYHGLSAEDALYVISPSFDQWLASVVADPPDDA